MSADVRAAFDVLMLESLLRALCRFGVSARTRRALAHNRATARLEVETDEFPVPTRQGGFESIVRWNVFLLRLLIDLEGRFVAAGCGIDLDGLGRVPCLAWADT